MVPDIHSKFHNQPFIMRRTICEHVFGHTDSITHTHTHTIKPPTAGVQLDIRPYQNKFCKAKEQAYLTYVRPILEYSCTVWDPYRIYQQRQREMVQRRAARFVCNQYHQTSSITNMMAGLDCEPLINRRRAFRMFMFYKMHSGEVAIHPTLYLTP